MLPLTKVRTDQANPRARLALAMRTKEATTRHFPHFLVGGHIACRARFSPYGGGGKLPRTPEVNIMRLYGTIEAENIHLAPHLHAEDIIHHFYTMFQLLPAQSIFTHV